MKTEKDNLKKSSDKIIETEQSARSSGAPDEENRTTRSFVEPEGDRQPATMLRACVRACVRAWYSLIQKHSHKTSRLIKGSRVRKLRHCQNYTTCIK
jgi:hypothetical protein